MKQMRDFVITSLQVWDIEIGSTIKNTAKELSKTSRVLYVNTPMDHSTWLRGGTKPSYTQRMDVIKGRSECLRQLNENMWVLDCPFMVYSVSKIPWKWLFDAVNRVNSRKIARFVAKKAAELGFSDFVNLIDTDIYRSFYMKEYLGAGLSVYYRRDYVIGEAYWHAHGSRLEAELCRKSDIVLANSLYFADQLRGYNTNTYDIETGVDLELYDGAVERATPPDIAPIPRPIVGYIGTVNGTRLDAEMLLMMARQRPGYSFVFTGPEDDYFKASELHGLSNVFFLGNKSVPELPSYIASYDVCINPQMVNSMTIGNYPLKIDEYLAMGKPTVATKTHTMEHIFSDYVFLADNGQQYLEMIDLAMEQVGDRAQQIRRSEFAHTHSWQNSVKKIYEIIEKHTI